MRIETDKVLFGGKPTPGIALVEPITIEASYEVRDVPLKAGRDFVYKGIEPVKTTITCSLYDDQDLADCREFIDYVRPSIDNSNTVTTWDVQHPSLGAISEFVIKSITYPRAQKGGVYIFVIAIEEHRPPERKSPQKVGGSGGANGKDNDGKVGPYEAITETGEAHSGEADSLAMGEQSEVDREIELQRRQRDAARQRAFGP